MSGLDNLKSKLPLTKDKLLNTVTIRHRDDGKQERLPISELLNWLLARIR